MRNQWKIFSKAPLCCYIHFCVAARGDTLQRIDALGRDVVPRDDKQCPAWMEKVRI